MVSKKASAPGGSTAGFGSATNTGESPAGTTTVGMTSAAPSGSSKGPVLLSSRSSPGSWAEDGAGPSASAASGAMVGGSDPAGAFHTGGLGVCKARSFRPFGPGWLAASAASRAVTSAAGMDCRRNRACSEFLKLEQCSLRDRVLALICSVSTRSVMP